MSSAFLLTKLRSRLLTATGCTLVVDRVLLEERHMPFYVRVSAKTAVNRPQMHGTGVNWFQKQKDKQ
ncbi:hypothetical protein B2M20_15320 [Nitrobacter vulgaris]|uniref:Uncharacterized protein n=1 Tax=Nitrobacter vulgaris TaxID=29421 RepID=A0A1V4HV99_NITVU|nr:hypothetical protein B2M20_15320 [Nitrobacter vulgaris]